MPCVALRCPRLVDVASSGSGGRPSSSLRGVDCEARARRRSKKNTLRGGACTPPPPPPLRLFLLSYASAPTPSCACGEWEGGFRSCEPGFGGWLPRRYMLVAGADRRGHGSRRVGHRYDDPPPPGHPTPTPHTLHALMHVRARAHVITHTRTHTHTPCTHGHAATAAHMCHPLGTACPVALSRPPSTAHGCS